MEWLKSLWSRWKVQVSVVGGVLVVATAYGTCSVDPTEVSNNDTTNTTEITETTSETVEVSATTETAGAEATTGDTTTTETTTTETTTE
tara:strand:+ start:5831 stop:6097 length:267 start_codon:yes stop_codon:yes gene_type:complete